MCLGFLDIMSEFGVQILEDVVKVVLRYLQGLRGLFQSERGNLVGS